MSALDIPAVHDAMCRSVRNAGRPGIAACAISALDIALWDLKARLLELPLARLLGVREEQVPVYGSGGFTTYHDTLPHCLKGVGGAPWPRSSTAGCTGSASRA